MRLGVIKDKTRTRPTRELLGVLWSYLRRFWVAMLLISIVMIIYTIAATYSPIIIADAIDILESVPSYSTVTNLILLFLLLTVAVWIFDSSNLWIMADLRTKLVHNLRIDTFDKLVDADMKYHHTQQSGNITQRVVGDTEEVANGINVFTTAASQMLLVGVTFLVVFLIDWTFALISLLAIPVAFVIIGVISSIGKQRMMRLRRTAGEVSAKLAEALSGVAISKSFNHEERTSGEIRNLNEEMYQNMNKLGIIFTMVMPSISMVSTILVALVLIMGGVKSDTLTIGQIYLGTVMVQRFLIPIIHLGGYFTQFQASLAALERIVEVQEAEPAITESQEARALDISNTSIVFKDVSFAYKTDTQVLSDINLVVNAGAKIALVGHTGAGKTTITALLMRFYDPIKGEISIGDQNLKDLALNSLYDSVSLVSQEPYLFADTVMENIRYGRPNASDKEIIDLCKIIGADQFIDVLPKGYQTVLQESGKSISAGQRQMITIARTWLSNPKILILDEATARLDAYSESLVQRAQNQLFEGRTTVVIAHRLSTIRDVDKIIVLENGKIVEQGTNDELLKKKNKYYELYKTYYAHQGVKSLDEVFANGEVPEPESIPLNVRHPSPGPHPPMKGKKVIRKRKFHGHD
jgi:ATP-binding cassette subfamily B protein